MLFGSPVFPLKEYGAALEAGYLCPACRSGRLAQPNEEHGGLLCDRCGGAFRRGWRRHHFAAEPPVALHGTMVDRLGGFYETIQNYAVVPQAGLPSENTAEAPHVGDFVVDIDRAQMTDAQDAAGLVYGFLDHVAPGQVRLYYSGSKGFHVVVPFQALGASPSPVLCSKEYRQLASAVHRATGVEPDYKIYSPGRMLRRPDSWHPKTGRYKVEIVPEELHDQEGLELLSQEPRGALNTTPPRLSMDAHALYQQAVEAVEAQQAFTGELTPQFNFEPGGTGVPPCVTWIDQHGLPGPSTRHAVYLIMANYWKSSGVPLESFTSFGALDQSCAVSRAREFARREDPNTSTPASVRVRDAEECVRYAYRDTAGFRCASVQALGLCQDGCSVKAMGSNPMVRLLGFNTPS